MLSVVQIPPVSSKLTQHPARENALVWIISKRDQSSFSSGTSQVCPNGLKGNITKGRLVIISSWKGY